MLQSTYKENLHHLNLLELVQYFIKIIEGPLWIFGQTLQYVMFFICRKLVPTSTVTLPQFSPVFSSNSI